VSSRPALALAHSFQHDECWCVATPLTGPPSLESGDDGGGSDDDGPPPLRSEDDGNHSDGPPDLMDDDHLNSTGPPSLKSGDDDSDGDPKSQNPGTLKFEPLALNYNCKLIYPKP